MAYNNTKMLTSRGHNNEVDGDISMKVLTYLVSIAKPILVLFFIYNKSENIKRFFL